MTNWTDPLVALPLEFKCACARPCVSLPAPMAESAPSAQPESMNCPQFSGKLGGQFFARFVALAEKRVARPSEASLSRRMARSPRNCASSLPSRPAITNSPPEFTGAMFRAALASLRRAQRKRCRIFTGTKQVASPRTRSPRTCRPSCGEPFHRAPIPLVRGSDCDPAPADRPDKRRG